MDNRNRQTTENAQAGPKNAKKKSSPVWAVVSLGLGALGFVFRFVLRGYVYWGYLCFFIIALILAHHFLPSSWWRVIVALTCLGLVYFCIVEIPMDEEHSDARYYQMQAMLKEKDMLILMT